LIHSMERGRIRCPYHTRKIGERGIGAVKHSIAVVSCTALILEVTSLSAKTFVTSDEVIEPETVTTVQDVPQLISPDGHWLLATIQKPSRPDERNGVVLIDVRSGKREVISNYESASPFYGRWLDDSKTFWFTVYPNPEPVPGVLLLGGVGKKQVVEVTRVDPYPLYAIHPSPDGRRLIVAFEDHFKAVQGVPSRVKGPLSVKLLDLVDLDRPLPGESKQQKRRLMQLSWQGNERLWAVPLQEDGTPSSHSQLRIDFGKGKAQTSVVEREFHYPQFSPDGRYRAETRSMGPRPEQSQFCILPAEATAGVAGEICLAWLVSQPLWSLDSQRIAVTVPFDGEIQAQDMRILDVQGNILV